MSNVAVGHVKSPLSPDYGGGAGFIGGTIPGIVTVNGAAASRHLYLFLRSSAKIVADTWSADDGTYQFDYLSPDEEFDLVARDHTRTYSDVIIPAINPWPYEAP